MITLTRGNLLESDAEALVNTVNTVGIMGKGIALQFKQAFPSNFRAYEAACRRGEVTLGKMFVHDMSRLQNPRFIINFPTKKHWKNKSRFPDIRSGLEDLKKVIGELNIHSIAIPPLGCGNGGLDWSRVRTVIEQSLSDLENVEIRVYEPAGAPAPNEIRVATARPRLTAARAAILALMNRYIQPGYHLTMLEIQKLVYFLQVAGQPLKLKFVKQKYGPYTEQLFHVLERLDGHYIRGYGDRSRDVSITLTEGAGVEAEEAVAGEMETQERFTRVAALIDGFETPYGLELLATVHWAAINECSGSLTLQDVIASVQQWNERKKMIFRPDHIRAAWERLRDEDWF